MKLNDIVSLNEENNDKENKDLNKTPPPGDTGEVISSAQAAVILGVTQSRIRQMIMDGELTSHKPAKGRRDNMLSLAQVKKHKDKMKGPGRPEKTEGASKTE